MLPTGMTLFKSWKLTQAEFDKKLLQLLYSNDTTKLIILIQKRLSPKSKKELLKSKQAKQTPTQWIVTPFNYWKREKLNDSYLQNIMSL